MADNSEASQPRYIVESLLPTGEIHLVGGPTGAGKSRWLLETLIAWKAGLPWLNYRSYPAPWLYVVNDRTKNDALRTINSLLLDPGQIPIVPAWDMGLGFNGVLDVAKKMEAELLVIEGFSRYVEGRTNHQVANSLQAISRAVNPNKLTIIGVVEQPKMKPRDRYLNPRQRVSGAAAWGHHCNTIFQIEPVDDANISNPERNLYVCPRNLPAMQLSATLADGHFRIIPNTGIHIL